MVTGMLSLVCLALPLVPPVPLADVDDTTDSAVSTKPTYAAAARGTLESEALLAALRVRPALLERENLEGAAESENGFHELPGGMVLGLVARPTGDWSGATVALEGGRLVVHRGGRSFALPPARADVLRACLAFATSPYGSDTLVDLDEFAPRVAPELVGTSIGRMAIDVDRAPHRHVPGSLEEKTLIVDHEPRFYAAGDVLVIESDLEVRFYEPDLLSTLGRRTRSLAFAWDLADGDGRLLRLVGDAPEGTDVAALATDLAPAAKMAAWIGFLRWAAQQDPAGIERVSATLAAQAAVAAEAPAAR